MNNITHYIELSLPGTETIRRGFFGQLIDFVHDHNHHFADDAVALSFSKDDPNFTIHLIRCVGSEKAVERLLGITKTGFTRTPVAVPDTASAIPNLCDKAIFTTMDTNFYSDASLNKKARERQSFLAKQGKDVSLDVIAKDLRHKASLKLSSNSYLPVKIYSNSQKRNARLLITRSTSIHSQRQSPTIFGLKYPVPVF